MKIEVVPYEPEHIWEILDGYCRERDAWLSRFPEIEKWTNGWKDSGPSITLKIDGVVVACGGIILQEWKKGEAWTLFSNLIKKYRKECFKVSRDFLSKTIKDKELRRVQAFVDPKHLEAHRFLSHLGFSWEGPLRKWGPNGEDVILYARVSKWEPLSLQ